MKKIICMLALSFLFCGGPSFAADSVTNRIDQTFRLGQKSGNHLMYKISSPLVLEFPEKEWTFGLTFGSGKYNYSYSDYSPSTGTSSTKSQDINFSTSELTGRYYIGNSFNIPFGFANYKISYPDWVYSGVTYDVEYSITQLNYGIGNEWTYDWGGYLGIDWYQSGIKLNDKATIKLKTGAETATTLAKATKTSTEIKAFSGSFLITLGFGF